MEENESRSSLTGTDRTENAVHVAVKLLLSGGMTHSIVTRAVIGMDCAENTIPSLVVYGPLPSKGRQLRLCNSCLGPSLG